MKKYLTMEEANQKIRDALNPPATLRTQKDKNALKQKLLNNAQVGMTQPVKE